jgi:hypothetical protein
VLYGKLQELWQVILWEEEKFGASTMPLGMSSKNVPVERQQLGMCRWTDVSDEPVPLLILVSV